MVTATAKSVTVVGGIVGASGASSGAINLGVVEKLTIGGSIVGGQEANSGTVVTGDAGSITIKGGIFGGQSTAGSFAGLNGTLAVAGSASKVTVNGTLVAGTYGSGTELTFNGAITATGTLGTVKIGSILGNATQQAFVVALGSNPTTPGNAEAIGKLIVRGGVSYGHVAAGQFANSSLAPADRIGIAERPDAGIGEVGVGGDWFHSNLTAGINDAGSNGFQSTDTRDPGDAGRQAVLGPVVIGGQVLDNPNSIGFSGFGAEKIVSIPIGGVTVFKSGDAPKSLDPKEFVDIAEIP
jgi:hypothetical protein